MPIIRTFNINKPGTKIDDLNGGVCGGSIQSGKVKIDDELLMNYDNLLILCVNVFLKFW